MDNKKVIADVLNNMAAADSKYDELRVAVDAYAEVHNEWQNIIPDDNDSCCNTQTQKSIGQIEQLTNELKEIVCDKAMELCGYTKVNQEDYFKVCHGIKLEWKRRKAQE